MAARAQGGGFLSQLVAVKVLLGYENVCAPLTPFLYAFSYCARTPLIICMMLMFHTNTSSPIPAASLQHYAERASHDRSAAVDQLRPTPSFPALTC